jgi:hypothetical protein
MGIWLETRIFLSEKKERACREKKKRELELRRAVESFKQLGHDTTIDDRPYRCRCKQKLKETKLFLLKRAINRSSVGPCGRFSFPTKKATFLLLEVGTASARSTATPPLKSLPNPQTLAEERRDDADAGPPRLRLQGAGPRVAVDAFVRSGFPAVAVDSGVGVLAAVAVLDRWARRRPAAAAGLLRRARPVPDGPGGRRRSAARQGTRRGRLRLRPSAPGEELHPQPGLDRLSPSPLPCPGRLSCLVGWWWFKDMTPGINCGCGISDRVRVRRGDFAGASLD